MFFLENTYLEIVIRKLSVPHAIFRELLCKIKRLLQLKRKEGFPMTATKMAVTISIAVFNIDNYIQKKVEAIRSIVVGWKIRLFYDKKAGDSASVDVFTVPKSGKANILNPVTGHNHTLSILSHLLLLITQKHQLMICCRGPQIRTSDLEYIVWSTQSLLLSINQSIIKMEIQDKSQDHALNRL